MRSAVATCVQCGANVAPAERFCENCGAALSEVRRVAVPRHSPVPDGIAVKCDDCGDGTYVDEYCTVCGNRRTEPDRDENHLDGIVLITDRGLEHFRNEDAAAAGTVAGAAGERPHAIVAAVCDGVSTSPDAYKASRAASTAGVDAMLKALAASRDMRSVALAGLDDAAKAAAAAETEGAGDRAAPSCTYAGSGRRFHIRGRGTDHRRQCRGQQGVLAARTARAATAPDRRRFPRAGTDLRGCTARCACRTERCAHPDPVAGWRRRIGTVGRVAV